MLADIHAPFHSPGAVHRALSDFEAEQVDLILILGDLVDAYPISSFDRSPERHSRVSEEREALRPVVDAIDRFDVPIEYIPGNHEERERRLRQRNPSLEGSIDIRSLWGIPERWNIRPYRSVLEIGDTLFLHGDGFGVRGGQGVAYRMTRKLNRSCVFGHFHTSEMRWIRTFHGDVLKGYSLGYLASPGVSAEYCPVNEWTPSYGIATVRDNRVSVDIREAPNW